MRFLEKLKRCFTKNKKYIIIGGTAVLSIVGTSVGYVMHKNGKISLSDWLKTASTEELEEAYEKLRLIFCQTGTKPSGMEQINRELSERSAKEWYEKHPPNLDPNFRWTDANRWDKD